MTSPTSPRTVARPPIALREPTGPRGAGRGDREAFERALARQTAAAGPCVAGRHDAPHEETRAVADPWTDRTERHEDAGASDDDASQSARDGDPSISPLDLERSPDVAGHAREASGERDDDPDDRRRWLDGVLEALDAIGHRGPAPGRPRDGLDVDTAVPGIGPVRLQLSWPDGALRVTLRCTTAHGVPNVAGNPYTESLRRALAARVPPVAFEVAGVETPEAPPALDAFEIRRGST